MIGSYLNILNQFIPAFIFSLIHPNCNLASISQGFIKAINDNRGNKLPRLRIFYAGIPEASN